jgi:hypothetical protein
LGSKVLNIITIAEDEREYTQVYWGTWLFPGVFSNDLINNQPDTCWYGEYYTNDNSLCKSKLAPHKKLNGFAPKLSNSSSSWLYPGVFWLIIG